MCSYAHKNVSSCVFAASIQTKGHPWVEGLSGGGGLCSLGSMSFPVPTKMLPVPYMISWLCSNSHIAKYALSPGRGKHYHAADTMARQRVIQSALPRTENMLILVRAAVKANAVKWIELNSPVSISSVNSFKVEHYF